MSGGLDNVFADVDSSGVAPELVAYLERVGQRPDLRRVDEESFDLLAPQPGDRLLEAGCGIGDDAAELARRVAPGGVVTALDLSAEMVATARQRHGDVPAAEFALGDVRELALPDAAYDGARAERVLQHLTDPAAAVRELTRVVRPGGRVVLADTDWATLAIGGVDDALVRQVMDHFLALAIMPRAGRHLRGYLADAGVRDLVVRAVVVTDDDLASASEVLPMLNPRISPEAGLVPPDVREQWFAALETAQTAGRFVCGVTMFVVGGRRP